MFRKKRLVGLLTGAMLMILPVSSAFASPVSFADFHFNAYPATESFQKVVSRTKPDAEQRWYLTLTKYTPDKTGVETPIAVSVKTFSQTGWAAPIHLKLGSQSKAYSSEQGIAKGTNCTLYMSGNSNAKGSYTFWVSGRYSS